MHVHTAVCMCKTYMYVHTTVHMCNTYMYVHTSVHMCSTYMHVHTMCNTYMYADVKCNILYNVKCNILYNFTSHIFFYIILYSNTLYHIKLITEKSHISSQLFVILKHVGLLFILWRLYKCDKQIQQSIVFYPYNWKAADDWLTYWTTLG